MVSANARFATALTVGRHLQGWRRQRRGYQAINNLRLAQKLASEADVDDDDTFFFLKTASSSGDVLHIAIMANDARARARPPSLFEWNKSVAQTTARSRRSRGTAQTLAPSPADYAPACATTSCTTAAVTSLSFAFAQQVRPPRD